MKSLLIAAIIATGFATVGTATANAGGSGGKSYAYEYCHYYKARALGAHGFERKQYMWAKYRACLREYGAY
ncbi:MAG: hypothetical protein ACR2OL_11005 [Anderseniella sp.]